MLALARRNQAEAGVSNVEYIPLPEASVDVIISNCVINLSANKDAVFHEAFRVLKDGGRLAISDIVLGRRLSDPVAHLVGLWTGCVAGALLEGDYRQRLEAAGFAEIDVEPTRVFERSDLAHMASDMIASGDIAADIDVSATLEELDGVVMSAFVRARKAAA